MNVASIETPSQAWAEGVPCDPFALAECALEWLEGLACPGCGGSRVAYRTLRPVDGETTGAVHGTCVDCRRREEV